MRLPPDAEGLVPRHAEDETLLAYLDGELPSREAVTTAAHLESCWRCRARVNALEASIREFLIAREQLDPPDLDTRPNPEASFRRRLAGHAHATPGASRASLLREWTYAAFGVYASAARLRAGIAAVVVTGLVIAGSASWWSVPLSAADVLARAEVHELIDLRCADLVVRSVVGVDRVNGASGIVTPIGVVETETDPASPAVRVSLRSGGGALDHAVVWGRDVLDGRDALAAAFPVPLAKYLAARQWAPGVDVRSYLRLIADRGDARVMATRRGDLFEISHPFPAGHESTLSEARLYVDATTWFPVRVSLFTASSGGTDELRFTRMTLEFLPRTGELAALFAAARPGHGAQAMRDAAPSGSDVSRTGSTPRRPLPLSWDAAPATDLEVAVAVALNDVGADLGEEVNVFPMSDGSLLVQGLVESNERQRAIEQALQRLPGGLRIEIYVPAAVGSGSELFSPPWRVPRGADVPQSPPPSVPVIVADAAGLRMPVEARLDDLVGRMLKARGTNANAAERRDAVARYANGIVSRSREAVFHAWALYRLDLQFAPDRTTALSPSALAPVARVRQSHRDHLARLAREVATSVEPLVASADISHGPSLAPGARALLDAASEADTLVRRLFTASPASVDVPVSLARLSSLLWQLAQEHPSPS